MPRIPRCLSPRSIGVVVAGIGLIAGGFLAAGAVEHRHDDNTLRRKVVLEHDLSGTPAEQAEKVTVLELEYAPGGSSPPHRHAGPVVVYVLSGALESALGDEPPKTYRTGESFFEPAGATHSVSRNASRTEPARFLAVMFSSKDARALTVPTE